MKEAIIVIMALIVISTAFSYSYIPQVVDGNFNIVSEIKDSNQSDFVLLIPQNWSILNIKYYGSLTNKEITLKDFHNEKCLALHLSFNSSAKIYVEVHPNGNGYVYLYNIKNNGFERKIVFVKVMKIIDIIPILAGAAPLWVFFSREGFKNMKKIKENAKKHKKSRRKKR